MPNKLCKGEKWPEGWGITLKRKGKRMSTGRGKKTTGVLEGHAVVAGLCCGAL
jgi:hypothetical protein